MRLGPQPQRLDVPVIGFDKEEVVAFVKAPIGSVNAPKQIDLGASLSNFSI